MFKKGQAALEFLTTYGWAFLVILVMIGALAYFGVLNPSKFVPDSCVFGSFMCDDALVQSNTITLKMRNSMEGIVITGVNITDLDSGVVFNDGAAADADVITIDGVDVSSDPALTAGKVFNLVATATGYNLGVGDKKKLAVEIYYYSSASGATFTKNTGGDIVATVQP